MGRGQFLLERGDLLRACLDGRGGFGGKLRLIGGKLSPRVIGLNFEGEVRLGRGGDEHGLLRERFASVRQLGLGAADFKAHRGGIGARGRQLRGLGRERRLDFAEGILGGDERGARRGVRGDLLLKLFDLFPRGGEFDGDLLTFARGRRDLLLEFAHLGGILGEFLARGVEFDPRRREIAGEGGGLGGKLRLFGFGLSPRVVGLDLEGEVRLGRGRDEGGLLRERGARVRELGLGLGDFGAHRGASRTHGRELRGLRRELRLDFAEGILRGDERGARRGVRGDLFLKLIDLLPRGGEFGGDLLTLTRGRRELLFQLTHLGRIDWRRLGARRDDLRAEKRTHGPQRLDPAIAGR